jgi:hypothetical protein
MAPQLVCAGAPAPGDRGTVDPLRSVPRPPPKSVSVDRCGKAFPSKPVTYDPNLPRASSKPAASVVPVPTITLASVRSIVANSANLFRLAAVLTVRLSRHPPGSDFSHLRRSPPAARTPAVPPAIDSLVGRPLPPLDSKRNLTWPPFPADCRQVADHARGDVSPHARKSVPSFRRFLPLPIRFPSVS